MQPGKEQTCSGKAVGVFAIAMLEMLLQTGCGNVGPGLQISRYRSEIQGGVSGAFANSGELEDSAGTEAREHYVAPDGSKSNDGTIDRPWNLETVLSHPKTVNPGDTIWIRNGEYRGSFVSKLIGRKGAPIIVRQYPGERATLIGCTEPKSNNATLLVKGEYTWFWGLEITNCETKRQTALSGSDPADIQMGTGVDLRGNDLKLINMVIHDTGGGIGAWTSAKRAELAGNIVYYNGFDGGDQGHGHGVYIQNEAGPKRLINNIIFHQYGTGIHAFGERQGVSTLDIAGNILFSNGSLSERSGFGRNLLIGGIQRAEGLTLMNNSAYYPLKNGGGNSIGNGAGCLNATLQDNYFAGPDSLTISDCTGLRVKGNSFAGSLPGGLLAYDFPENVVAPKPTGSYSKLRPDTWEPGRGFLAIFNWEHKARFHLEVTELGWTAGQKYILRAAEDFWGSAIHGVYDGDTIEVPMVGWNIASPAGAKAPASSLPEFGAFVLELDYTQTVSPKSK